MKLAWIENGTVRDVTAGDPFALYVAEVAALYSAPVPDGTEAGDTWDGVTLTKRPLPPEPVPPTQEELDAIAAQEAARVLAAERKALLLKIDNDTDAIYRAVQGERAMEYLQAESDAKYFKSTGYTGTPPDSVGSWANAKGKTAIWATDDILTTAAGWRQAQSSIRATRLTLKEQARTGNDMAPIAAQWAGFLMAIKAALGVA
jgi:hypothetical protein